MKPYLPYNILLAITLASCVLMVIFNFALKNSFSVMIEYDPPAVTKSTAAGFEAKTPVLDYADDAMLDSPDFDPVRSEYPANSIDAGAVTFPLEINSATMQEIMLIPQVGEVMARRIVQYRDVIGGYESLEQLMEIKGIAEKTFQQLSAYFYITGDEWDMSR